jgi:hypothetical protein
VWILEERHLTGLSKYLHAHSLQVHPSFGFSEGPRWAAVDSSPLGSRFDEEYQQQGALEHCNIAAHPLNLSTIIYILQTKDLCKLDFNHCLVIKAIAFRSFNMLHTRKLCRRSRRSEQLCLRFRRPISQDWRYFDSGRSNLSICIKNKQKSVVLFRKRTIPTERQPLLGEF